MKKQRLFIGSLFIIVSVLSGLVVAGFTIQNNTPKVYATDSISVALYDDRLSPDSVALKIGQKLRVVNYSSVVRELSLGSGQTEHGENHEQEVHQTSSHDHDGRFSTGTIGTDEAWEGSFSEAGTYFLHDHDRPELNLLLVVYR